LKLVPLLGSIHYTIHNHYKKYGNYEAYETENDLLRDRVWHLYQISKRSYVSSIDYKNQFMLEFDSRTDIVNGKEIKIWDGFDRQIL